MRHMKVQEQAVLVRVGITKWSGSKTDKTLSGELASSKGAEEGVLRVRKTLLDSPHLKALNKLAGQVRNQIVSKYTMPWSEDGERLLPVDAIDKFEALIEDAKQAWDQHKRNLADDYELAVQRAQHSLGGAFDPADYPSKQEVLDKFEIGVRFRPLPDGGDLRVKMPEQRLEAMREAIEADVNDRVQQATAAVHARVVETLTHLAEKLRDYGQDENGKVTGVFRDSTVENVQQLADVLPALNITGDPKLESAANTLLTKLRDLDPKTLRESPAARERVAKHADSIVEDLSGFMD